MSETRDTPSEIRVTAYPFPSRFVNASFYTVSRVSIFVIGLSLLAGMYYSPPLLLRLMVFLGLLPALLAVVISRAFAATVRREEGRWRLVRGGLFRRGERIELNEDAVQSLAPWRLPVPGLGMTLRLAEPHGERRIELQVDAPGSMVNLLFPGTGAAWMHPRQPAVAYANARSARNSSGWLSFTARFVMFPLVPAFILFRLHQYVQYGGMLGQYHLHGLQPYLSTLAFHWILVLMYLVLWAGVLRGFGEFAAASAARFNPGMAMVVRIWAERTVSFLYYGGVIGLIVVRASL